MIGTGLKTFFKNETITADVGMLDNELSVVMHVQNSLRKSSIYEIRIKSLNELGFLHQLCDSLEQVAQLFINFKQQNVVQLTVQEGKIIFIKKHPLKKDKIVAQLGIQFKLVNLKEKQLIEEALEKINLKCDSKGDLNNEEIKDILYLVGVSIEQIIKANNKLSEMLKASQQQKIAMKKQLQSKIQNIRKQAQISKKQSQQKHEELTKKYETLIQEISKIKQKSIKEKNLEPVQQLQIDEVKDLPSQQVEKIQSKIEIKQIIYSDAEDKKLKYEGQVKDGKYEGKGILIYKNGSKYEGQFKNGLFNGKGVFYQENSDRYQGEFLNGQGQGKGIYYFKDGGQYQGDFLKGKFEGKGIFYLKDGKKLYEGDFKKDNYEGQGIKYLNNGAKWIGSFKNDLFDGEGVYYFGGGGSEKRKYKEGQIIVQ